VGREHPRNLGADDRVPERHAPVEAEPGGEALELAPVRALLLRERRPVHVEPHVVRLHERAQDDVQPLRGRVAPEREQPQPVRVAARAGAVELGKVDPVPDRAQLARGEWERPLVDRRHRGRDALCRAQQAARPPVREPEHERDAERAHERRREDGVDRTHVRDDGASAQTPELSRERRVEAQAPTRLAPRAERPHATVRGQHLVDHGVRQDHDLVDPRRERADLRHRRRQRRVRGVDLLRDEDEPRHALRRSRSRRA
jgi:hypothetical protein